MNKRSPCWRTASVLIFLRHCPFIFPLLAGHTLAQTNPFILSFQRNGALTWTNVLPGYSYGVQHASVLQTGAWRFTGGFTNIEPTGSTMTVQVPIAGTQGYYQVVNNGSCCTNSGGSNLITAINLGSLAETPPATRLSGQAAAPAGFE